MIRFAAGSEFAVFHYEIGRVLHDVSVWAGIANVTVEVRGGRAAGERTSPLYVWDFAVCLSQSPPGASDAQMQLFDYLQRILPSTYAIELRPNCLRVQFDARGARPGFVPAPAPPGSARNGLA